MPNPKNDIPNKQSVSKNIMEKVYSYDDEIDLIDYFRVFWKRKYFIFLSPRRKKNQSQCVLPRPSQIVPSLLHSFLVLVFFTFSFQKIKISPTARNPDVLKYLVQLVVDIE